MIRITNVHTANHNVDRKACWLNCTCVPATRFACTRAAGCPPCQSDHLSHDHPVWLRFQGEHDQAYHPPSALLGKLRARHLTAGIVATHCSNGASITQAAPTSGSFKERLSPHWWRHSSAVPHLVKVCAFPCWSIDQYGGYAGP